MIRPIRKLIVHCSDSAFGSAATIDGWHRKRGWSGCGYHFVITNGVKNYSDRYDPAFDGLLQRARPVELKGAHCRGHNEDSLGICLIGRAHFSDRQLHTLRTLLQRLLTAHSLTPEAIHGHYEFSKTKTCPNIRVELLRDLARCEVPPHLPDTPGFAARR